VAALLDVTWPKDARTALRLVCGLGKRLVLHFEFDCSRAVHPDDFSV
jgi:hypothetical protein